MQFEWDVAKNELNIIHHGIDFADVEQMFNYPLLTHLDDRLDYGEERWISIGMLGPGVAVVIWTERDGDTIRIISARKANKNERRRYETYLTHRWDKLQMMDDSQIDYSDIPPLDDDFFAHAKLVMPNAIQIDPDILRWFRHHSPDYAEEINQILRTYISSYDRAA